MEDSEVAVGVLTKNRERIGFPIDECYRAIDHAVHNMVVSDYERGAGEVNDEARAEDFVVLRAINF